MTGLRLRLAQPGDRELLAGFLHALSPDSAYQRFLTGFAGSYPPSLIDALLPSEPRGGALLGFVGRELVGHALWVRLDDPRSAEVAVVVADRHQRQGIGTALTYALTTELVTSGIERVQVVSSPANRAVAAMVARHASDAVRELDGPTLTYSFPAPAPTVLRRSA